MGASVNKSGDGLEVGVKIGKWYGRRGFLLGGCLRFLCQRWFKFDGKRKPVLIDYTEARPDVPHYRTGCACVCVVPYTVVFKVDEQSQNTFILKSRLNCTNLDIKLYMYPSSGIAQQFKPLPRHPVVEVSSSLTSSSCCSY